MKLNEFQLNVHKVEVMIKCYWVRLNYSLSLCAAAAVGGGGCFFLSSMLIRHHRSRCIIATILFKPFTPFVSTGQFTGCWFKLIKSMKCECTPCTTHGHCRHRRRFHHHLKGNYRFKNANKMYTFHLCIYSCVVVALAWRQIHKVKSIEISFKAAMQIMILVLNWK